MSYANAAPEAPLAWYRQFWPWFLIALPATTVVACMYTIWLAISNPEVVWTSSAQADTAWRPYSDVRSAYPQADAKEGTPEQAPAPATESVAAPGS